MESLPPFVAEIAKQGLLGVVLLFFIWRTIHLEKRLDALTEARMSDWKTLGEIVSGNSTVLGDWNHIQGDRTKAIETNAAAQAAAAEVMKALVEQVRVMTTQLQQSGTGFQRMRDVILQIAARVNLPVGEV
jgi:hypothetical protein